MKRCEVHPRLGSQSTCSGCYNGALVTTTEPRRRDRVALPLCIPGGRLDRRNGAVAQLSTLALRRAAPFITTALWVIRWQADPDRRKRSDRGREAAQQHE